MSWSPPGTRPFTITQEEPDKVPLTLRCDLQLWNPCELSRYEFQRLHPIPSLPAIYCWDWSLTVVPEDFVSVCNGVHLLLLLDMMTVWSLVWSTACCPDIFLQLHLQAHWVNPLTQLRCKLPWSKQSQAPSSEASHHLLEISHRFWMKVLVHLSRTSYSFIEVQNTKKIPVCCFIICEYFIFFMPKYLLNNVLTYL